MINGKWWLMKEKINIKRIAFAAILLLLLSAIISIVRNFDIARLTTKSKLITTLNGEAYVVVDNKITDCFTKQTEDGNTSVKLEQIPANYKLYEKDKEYYFNSSDKKSEQVINPIYPLILNNGAYLYLYHNNYSMLSCDFHTINAKEGTFLNNGLIFDDQNQKAAEEKVLLLKLPNGLFMNLMELQVETEDIVTTIEMHSILQLNENGIRYYSLYENDLILSELPIADRTAMIQFADKRITYNAFYEKIPSMGQTDEKGPMDTFRVEQDLYQYFLGIRYDYQGDKTFFRTKNDYFMELNEQQFFLCSEPMYYAKEPKILLPCDYVLIQPRLFTMNRLPALSQITNDGLATYTLSGDVLNTYSDIILFDGTDTYIFFDNTQIFWGQENISITPLSTVTVSEDGTIEIYQLKTDTYEIYKADGYQEVCATTENNTTFNLSKDILYRPDGQEQILFSQPSLLTEDK